MDLGYFAESAIAAGLVIALIVAVVIFFRWSQRNIKANTQRIKQELFEESAGPARIEMPATAPRGEADDPAQGLAEQLDDYGRRLAAVEERLARLERTGGRAGDPTPR